MTLAEFEPEFPASDRPYTQALDRVLNKNNKRLNI
jgi:hypothetical protein